MMTSAKTKIMAAVASLMMLTACEMETSHNGDLDGFWQLRQVDSLQVAGQPSADVRSTYVFWAVQANMLEIRDARETYGGIIFKFNHTGDMLILSEPLWNMRKEGDTLVTNVETLKPFGLTQLCDTLTIEHLGSEEMKMRSKMLRMHFRRY